MSDDTLIKRACSDYRRRFGEQAPIPSRAASEVLESNGSILVRLQNVNGILAEYQYKPKSDKLVLFGTLLDDPVTDAALDRDEAIERVWRILRRLKINLKWNQVAGLLDFDLLNRKTLVWDLDS